MQNNIQILRTPDIKKLPCKKFKTEDRILQEIVDNFTLVLENNIKREELQLFYNNISTLKVDSKSILIGRVLELFNDNITTGQYYLEDNIISVLPIRSHSFLTKYVGIDTEEYVASICHELFHMASTIIDKDSNIVFSGFSQMGKTNIGVAIDDAYTEILLYRYFNLNREYMSYDYEVIITSVIEKIIGIDKMTSMYLTADLYGLVKELEKYNTRENIIKFLEDLDAVYVLQEHTKKYRKDIIYYHNEVARFLTSTYINKLNIDIINNNITNVEYNARLDSVLDKIHMAFDKLEIEDRKKVKRNNLNR